MAKKVDPTLSGCTMMRVCVVFFCSVAALIGCVPQTVSVEGWAAYGSPDFDALGASGEALRNEKLPGKRTAPFPGQPIAGVSGGFIRENRLITVLDNGYGLAANSHDFLPRIVGWSLQPETGIVEPDGSLVLSDPDQLFPFALTVETSTTLQESQRASWLASRIFTGSDIDPEAVAPGDHGTFWIGDELGPFLLHFGEDGALLAPPLSVPLPEELMRYGRQQSYFRSPDFAGFRNRSSHDSEQRANLPRSKGIEGLTRVPDTGELLLLMEGPLKDQPNQSLLSLFAFSLDSERFEFLGFYPLSRPYQESFVVDRHKIGEILALDRSRMLVVETDDGHGTPPEGNAQFKKIYLVDIRSGRRVLEKREVTDLMRLPPNVFGVRDFPFVTIEGLARWTDELLLVFNDNNFPKAGGRSRELLDASEFLWIRIPGLVQQHP